MYTKQLNNARKMHRKVLESTTVEQITSEAVIGRMKRIEYMNSVDTISTYEWLPANEAETDRILDQWMGEYEVTR